MFIIEYDFDVIVIIFVDELFCGLNVSECLLNEDVII